MGRMFNIRCERIRIDSILTRSWAHDGGSHRRKRRRVFGKLDGGDGAFRERQISDGELFCEHSDSKSRTRRALNLSTMESKLVDRSIFQSENTDFICCSDALQNGFSSLGHFGLEVTESDFNSFARRAS